MATLIKRGNTWQLRFYWLGRIGRPAEIQAVEGATHRLNVVHTLPDFLRLLAHVRFPPVGRVGHFGTSHGISAFWIKRHLKLPLLNVRPAVGTQREFLPLLSTPHPATPV